MSSLWIHGISGKMGRKLTNFCHNTKEVTKSERLVVIGGSSRSSSLSHLSKGIGECNLIIDFTGREGNQVLLEQLFKDKAKQKKILIGSTNLDQSQILSWKNLAVDQGCQVLHAVNTSLGIYLALQAALKIAGLSSFNHYDIELEETHHRDKVDSPSGTAKFIAETMAQTLKLQTCSHRKGLRQQNELGIQTTRGGGVIGEHKIRFIGDDDEISISHRAFSRDLFTKGAIVLAKWLLKQNHNGFKSLADISPNDLV